MAKAAAIDLNDAFTPPTSQLVATPNAFGDFLPSLSSSAGPGPGSVAAAATRLSGQVLAVSNAKERAPSGHSSAAKRHSGPPTAQSLQPTMQYNGDSATGGQQNAKLPPLLHGYGVGPAGTNLGRTALLSAGSQQQPQLFMEPMTQQAAMLPGPPLAAHPYQPKRKPPSAFMRNNPMRQQLEASSAHRAASAGSSRSFAAAYDMLYSLPADGSGGAVVSAGGPPLSPVQQQQLQQQQAFADEVIAAAQAAMLQGQQQQQQQQQQPWPDGGGGYNGNNSYAGGGGGGGGFSAAPPWGVSSVSDLEALDSILDQLVVVDARMRKALLKGPLISFETVVPEHVMNAARGQLQQQQQRGPGGEEEKDRTFITAVKGMGVEAAGEGEGEEEAAAEAAEAQAAAGAPPPSPAPQEGAGAAAAAQQAARYSRGAEDSGEPRDSSLFPASIPNPGMHPTFTRAYLTSKLASKPQHLPPPPPATAEHLLRSRPPPFIAAPSYDQLCSQIRDVQRQYTCGTSKSVAGQGGSASGAAAGAGGGGLPGGAATNQYIAGLDGPSLEEVVAQQELPISLERVRPTFVALKQKAARAASPRRRPGSPGAGRAPGEALAEEGGGGPVVGRS